MTSKLGNSAQGELTLSDELSIARWSFYEGSSEDESLGRKMPHILKEQ